MKIFNQYKKQILSIIITLLVYTYYVDFYTASICVIGVGFHEYSHLFCAQRLKLKTKGFYIIPFLGGISLISGKYPSFKEKAAVALAGPIGGGLLATLIGILGICASSFHLERAAYLMAAFNLFNLLPLVFLDGGQILDVIFISINEKFAVVLKAALTIVAVYMLHKISFMITGIIIMFSLPSAIIDCIYVFRGKYYNKIPEHKKLTNKQIILVFVSYMITVFYLLTIIYILISRI